MQTYHYTESGLDNVFLQSEQFHFVHGEMITIPKINELLRAISFLLASRKTKLSGGEIRFLRTEMGLTPAQLANELCIKEAELRQIEAENGVMPVWLELNFRILACARLKIEPVISMDTYKDWALEDRITARPIVLELREEKGNQHWEITSL